MADLSRTLQELRQERNQAEREVERLDYAISALQGLVGRNHLVGRPTRQGRTARMGRPRRGMSAAGRRKIAAAQRARWAQLREKRSQNGKRHLSAAARKRIATAQRLRWAKVKAAKKAAVRAPKKALQKVQATAA